MDWATIRVPVPREFVAELDGVESDEQRMTLLPRLMGRYPLTMGGYDLGTWTVESVEITMGDRGLDSGPHRFSPPRAAVGRVPVYWVTLTKAVE